MYCYVLDSKSAIARELLFPGHPSSTSRWGVQLSALPKDTTSKLAGLFSTTSHKCQPPSREAIDTIFESLSVGFDKGNKPQVYGLRSGRSNHYAIASLNIS